MWPRRLLGTLLLILAAAEGERERAIAELDQKSLFMTVNRNRRTVAIMYNGLVDTRMQRFMPWLFAIAQLLPRQQFVLVDVSHRGSPDLVAAFELDDSPAVRLFQRDRPAGERVVNYVGPVSFEPLLQWCSAVLEDKEHPYSAPGVEPPGMQQLPQKGGARAGASAKGAGASAKRAGASAKSTGAEAGGRDLPDSVRQMAETMVRESRLQRAFKQSGGGLAEQYEARVSELYQQIVRDTGIDSGDKFAVQVRAEVRSFLV